MSGIPRWRGVGEWSGREPVAFRVALATSIFFRNNSAAEQGWRSHKHCEDEVSIKSRARSDDHSYYSFKNEMLQKSE